MRSFHLPVFVQAIPDSREREELYNEHMKERERKERELKKIETKKLMAEFRALLEHTPSIKAGFCQLNVVCLST